MIRRGRVAVNGRTVTVLGAKARPSDRVTVDGKALPRPRGPVYLVLNKPAGVVSTARDPEGRPAVVDMVPRELGRVFPVGRLDVRSTGLVLLTNDGALAERLAHPRHHVPREYRVKVHGAPDEHALARVRRGIDLEDGRSAPAQIWVERRLPTKTWLRVVVIEGRPHLVRRLCEAIRLRVDKLERVALGPLRLGRLPRGAARHLTPAEVAALRREPAARATRPAHSAPRRREPRAPRARPRPRS